MLVYCCILLDNSIKSSYSSTEETKERINQINSQLDLYINQLIANRDKFEKVYLELNSKFNNIRNILLSLVTFIIPTLIAFLSRDNFGLEQYLPQSILIVAFVIVVIFVYSNIQKRRKTSRFLTIQKVFHDGYTTINFMKALLRNPFYIDQLDRNGSKTLDIYFHIIRGGIVSRIRNTICNAGDKDLSEQLYGDNEYELYSYLIKRSTELYKENKNIKEDLMKYFKPGIKDLFSIFDKYYIIESECEDRKL